MHPSEGHRQLAELNRGSSTRALGKKAGVSHTKVVQVLGGGDPGTAAKKLTAVGISLDAWRQPAQDPTPAKQPAAVELDDSALGSAQKAMQRANEMMNLNWSGADPNEQCKMLRALGEATMNFAKIRGEIAPPEATLAKSPVWKRTQARILEWCKMHLNKTLTTDALRELASLIDA